MTDAKTDVENINSHFDSMGVLSLEMENGDKLGVEVFACKSCGSVIAIKDAHWKMHTAFPAPE